MASVNKTILLGNLTRDPDLRYTKSGTAVAEFGLALNRKHRNKEGERVEEVTFVDVTLWGRVAEVADKYLSKGRLAFIEGRLHLDQWTDRESGQKRQRLKVIGENLQLMPGGDRGGDRSHAVAGRPAQGGTSPGDADPGQAVGNDDDDEIPF